MEARTKRIFKLVFVTLFVDLLAFTLILPLLPKILDYYSTNDKSGAYKILENNLRMLQNLLNLSESQKHQVFLAGILGSWFSMLQFISSPFLGALSDRFGRKPIILLAMSGSVISYAVWFMAGNSFALFILSRTIGGLCKGNVGLSLTIISDVSDENSRGKGMAVVGSSFSLAFIMGPLLGAYLTTLAEGDQLQNQLIKNPSLIATLLSLFDLAIVIFFMHETNTKTKTSKAKSQKSNKESILSNTIQYINPVSLFSFDLVKHKTKEETVTLQRVGFIYFYYLLLYSGLEFTLSFLTHLRFGFSSMQQGKLYLFSGILMVIVQGGYIRRIKGGMESLMAIIGLTLIIPSFILMGLASNVSQIYYSLVLYSFSSAVVVPCLTTIISSHSPLDSRGTTMGTFRSIGSLARAVGPCVASFVFWTFGPIACYLSGAVALLIPLYKMSGLYTLMRQQGKQNLEKSKKITTNGTKLAKAN